MSDDGRGSREIRMRIHRDHLYIDAACHERHLDRIANVALLRNENDLLILPIVGAESGGFFVKQINARGDRAIHAADFFRMNGIDETRERFVEALWDERAAGYSIHGFFAEDPTALALRK